ncbi:MAG: PVC-type heme-binding CxxCH protein, partial [Verrucomicrobiota bacterium]
MKTRYSLILLAGLIALLTQPLLAAKESAHPYADDKGGTDAQFLRISLSGEKRTLTLAEVEVYSGGKNIATSGKAKQSATGHGGDAVRAIDGNKDPDYNKKGQTHTPVDTANPWWELDLGEEKSIGSVGVWNRGGSLGQRLDGFTIQLLDADRKVVWEKLTLAAPKSSVHLQTVVKGKTAYLDASGKETNSSSWKDNKANYVELTARAHVEVPAGHRDPAPFAFAEGDTVALIGNALGERFQHHGHLETALQGRLPELELTIRNMAVSGDQVGKFPRSKNFSPVDAYLQHVGADVIGCFFGYNESFDEKPSEFTERYIEFIQKLRSYQPNGESFPRIVLFSPIAHENLNDPNLPNGKKNNRRLAIYTEATRAAAEEAGVAFVDLFNPSQALYAENEEPLTINGIHLNELGQKLLAETISDALAPDTNQADENTYEAIRERVKAKNHHWFNRYRAINGNDIWGSRAGLKFVNDQTNAEVLQHELTMLDVMTANRDEAIWAAAIGKDLTISDGNVPAPVPVISNVGGGSQSSNATKEGSLDYISGEDGITKMTMPEGFEVNLFADEAMFPEMVNPVQMQVDTKGRLWVAVWPSYPKWEPLHELRDALLILEDTDKDGVADKCTKFATIHSPLGFEFWNGGVLVTSQPDLIFLKDTDGDDVADHSEIVLHGYGSSDTHHAANNLILGPGGNLYWQSGVFLQHNHEHPWGPSLEATNSAMYRFDPRRYTVALHANNSPNPHGIAFDEWGYHYANDGTGGRSYQVRPEGEGFAMHMLLTKEVRPVAADAIVSSSHFPEEMQGNFLVANTIGFLGLKNYKLHREGFTRTEKRQNKDKKTGEVTNEEVTVEHAFGEVWGTPEEELLVSSDGNFRPTDAVFGEDGSLFVADWCNVIIGHMQHNIRDPNRDKKHGRIYRITYPSRPL